MYIYLKMR